MLRYKRQYTGDVKFRVVLEYDPEAHSFGGMPELPGCVGW
jgi:hypothetical protein